MLKLSSDQHELLEQLALRRHAAAIGTVLAETWPAMTSRLGERWPAFVEAALQQGRRHGCVDPADLARYASLWCFWGPAFDDKPGFEWAREILADPRRPAQLRMHQLIHHTRDDVQRQAPAAPGATPVVTLAQFDTALAMVDTQMAAASLSKSVFPNPQPRAAVKACDIGRVDAMLAEIDQAQEYRLAGAVWQRAGVVPLESAPWQWTRGPDAPVELALTSRALHAGPVARLNLKVEAPSVCNPRVHPEVVHTSAQGRLAWKGRDTARLSLSLYALPAFPAATAEAIAVAPGVAAATPCDLQRIEVASCGLRDAGAPFGALALSVAVFPATQWLAEWRHAAWSAFAFPALTGVGAEAAAVAPVCRLEADGVALDVTERLQAWPGLQRAFRQGMERLYNEWSRVLDGQQVQMEVVGVALAGQSGLTWGYRRTDPARVLMRVEGAVDMLACTLDLRLTGELATAGARSRLILSCKGRSELRLAVLQLGDQASPPGQPLSAVLRSWRFPVVLEIDPIASEALVVMTNAATPAPMLGAIAGECGLRPRPDGLGHQWFFALRLEPVAVLLHCQDPIVGSRTLTQPLLPAMTLVDWSGG